MVNRIHDALTIRRKVVVKVSTEVPVVIDHTHSPSLVPVAPYSFGQRITSAIDLETYVQGDRPQSSSHRNRGIGSGVSRPSAPWALLQATISTWFKGMARSAFHSPPLPP